MTDKEKLEKLVAFIKSAENCYADHLVKGSGVGDFGGKLAAIYDIEQYMEVELQIPMGYYDAEEV